MIIKQSLRKRIIGNEIAGKRVMPVVPQTQAKDGYSSCFSEMRGSTSVRLFFSGSRHSSSSSSKVCAGYAMPSPLLWGKSTPLLRYNRFSSSSASASASISDPVADVKADASSSSSLSAAKGGDAPSSPSPRPTEKNDLITVMFPNRKESHFHPVWLRDHCRCVKCYHPITKQRLLDTSSIPLDLQVSSMFHEFSPTTKEWSLKINWKGADKDSRHQSIYKMDWLYRNSYNPKLEEEGGEGGSVSHNISERSGAPRPNEINLWGEGLANALPITHYDEIMAGDEGLKKWLRNIEKFGLGFVDGVPVSKEKSQELVERISFIRQTHYGTFWDFTSDLSHGDTAYTTLGLPAHTDTTYFTDPIGLQFFHLLKHTGKGGVSLLVDGFNVALQLQEESRWAFDALTKLLISSQSAGDTNILMQPTPLTFPIIKLHPVTGNLLQIRFNNDDRSTLSMASPGDVDLFYAALKEWTKLVKRKENELWVPLKPGRAVIMDNWRVMHGRSSFNGERRMVGAYIGWDDYQSRLKTLVYSQRELL